MDKRAAEPAAHARPPLRRRVQDRLAHRRGPRRPGGRRGAGGRPDHRRDGRRSSRPTSSTSSASSRSSTRRWPTRTSAGSASSPARFMDDLTWLNPDTHRRPPRRVRGRRRWTSNQTVAPGRHGHGLTQPGSGRQHDPPAPAGDEPRPRERERRVHGQVLQPGRQRGDRRPGPHPGQAADGQDDQRHEDGRPDQPGRRGLGQHPARPGAADRHVVDGDRRGAQGARRGERREQHPDVHRPLHGLTTGKRGGQASQVGSGAARCRTSAPPSASSPSSAACWPRSPCSAAPCSCCGCGACVPRSAAILGPEGERDLVALGADLQDGFRALHDYVHDVAERQDGRLHDRRGPPRRRDRALRPVCYAAYNEMSGRQSTSIALLDSSALWASSCPRSTTATRRACTPSACRTAAASWSCPRRSRRPCASRSPDARRVPRSRRDLLRGGGAAAAGRRARPLPHAPRHDRRGRRRRGRARGRTGRELARGQRRHLARHPRGARRRHDRRRARPADLGAPRRPRRSSTRRTSSRSSRTRSRSRSAPATCVAASPRRGPCRPAPPPPRCAR